MKSNFKVIQTSYKIFEKETDVLVFIKSTKFINILVYVIVIILPDCSVGKSGNDKQHKICNYNIEYFLHVIYNY